MKQLLPGIVMGLLVLAGIAVLPAIWKGTSPFLQEEGTAGLGWFWGERMRRGLRRGIAAANLACGGLAVALIALGLGDGKDGIAARVAGWVSLAGLLLFAMIVLVTTSRRCWCRRLSETSLVRCPTAPRTGTDGADRPD
jgi:hypothetical protein